MSETGLPGYRGYEYQIDVSVWLSLLFMFEKRGFAVNVEPASHEDLEATATDDADAACRFASAGARILVQIKSRSDRNLQLAELKKIVMPSDGGGQRGPAPRPRPIEMLAADSEALYVLVTNAAVTGKGCRDFVVSEVGAPSASSHLPGNVAAPQGAPVAQLAPRLTILEAMEREVVLSRIQQLLQRACHVPSQRTASCTAALREQVRDRLTGDESSAWDKAEIEGVLRLHDGLPMPTRSLSVHVPPRNTKTVRGLLDSRNAALIYGPPGVGKTLLAESLVHDLRLLPTPFMVVNQDASIAEVRRALYQPGCVAFFLDDPWGKTRIAARAVEWRNEMGALIRDARPDKKFLIVTREALLTEVWPGGETPQWLRRIALRLSSQDYGSTERSAIRDKLRMISPRATAWHDREVADHWRSLCEGLPEPAGLVEALRQIFAGPEGKSIRVQELIERCNQEHLVETLAQHVIDAGNEEIIAHLLCWAALRTANRRRVPQNYRAVLERATWEEELMTLSRCVRSNSGYAAPALRVAASMERRNWLQEDGLRGLHISDTRIEAALEEVMRRRPDETVVMVECVLAHLAKGARKTAAVKFLEALVSRRQLPPRTLVSALDDWLINRATQCDLDEFPQAIAALGHWGTGGSAQEQFAQAFYPSRLSRQPKPVAPRGFLDDVGPDFSDWNENVRARIRQDSACLELAERLLSTAFAGQRGVMPRHDEAISAFHELWRSGSDQATNLAACCLRGMSDDSKGDPWTLEHLAEGVGRWGTDAQVLRSLHLVTAKMAAAERWYESWIEDEGGELEEGVLDAAYEAHLLDMPGERLAPLEKALDTVVRHLGQRLGPRWLADHSQNSTLRRSCYRALGDMPRAPGLEDAFRTCAASIVDNAAGELLYRSVGRAGCKVLEPLLLLGLSAENVSLVQGALSGLAYLHPPREFGHLISKTASAFSFTQRIRLLAALERFDGPRRHIAPSDYQDATRVELSDEERVLQSILDAPETQETKSAVASLSGRELCVLEALVRAEDLSEANRAMVALATGGASVARSLGSLLASSTDKHRRYAGYCALAIVGAEDELRHGLQDEHFRVRRVAIEALADRADDDKELRGEIVRLSTSDPSAPVRECCATIIGRHGWSEGVLSLAELLTDGRDVSQAIGMDDPPECPVARAATRALSYFVEQTAWTGPALRLLEDGSTAQADPVVHCDLASLLGRKLETRAEAVLLHLLGDDWIVRSSFRGENSLRVRSHAAAWSLMEAVICHDACLECNYSELEERVACDEPRIAAPLMVMALHAWPECFTSIGDVAVARESREKLPWIDLFVSAEYPVRTVDHGGSGLLAKASSDLGYWLELSRTSDSLISDLSLDLEGEFADRLASLVTLVRNASYLRPAFAYSVYLWFGDIWGRVLEDHDLLSELNPRTHHPRRIPVMSTWNLAGCE